MLVVAATLTLKVYGSVHGLSKWIRVFGPGTEGYVWVQACPVPSLRARARAEQIGNLDARRKDDDLLISICAVDFVIKQNIHGTDKTTIDSGITLVRYDDMMEQERYYFVKGLCIESDRRNHRYGIRMFHNYQTRERRAGLAKLTRDTLTRGDTKHWEEIGGTP